MTDKLELTRRLQHEGRWPEAVAFKNARIKELRRSGLLRKDASDAAWRELEEAFPPLPADPDPTPIGLAFGGKMSVFVTPLPPGWRGLPKGQSDEAGKLWVFRNLARMVEVEPDRVVINWRSADPPPDSQALAILRAAVLGTEDVDDFWASIFADLLDMVRDVAEFGRTNVANAKNACPSSRTV